MNSRFEFSTVDLIKFCQDPLVQAVIELKSKRIAAQQKRRMNSLSPFSRLSGRWSKMMRDKYE